MGVEDPKGRRRTWRAVRQVVPSLAVATFGVLTLGVLTVVWGAAVASLLDGVAGDGWLAVAYAVLVLTVPLAVPGVARVVGALHRRRLARAGVVVPEPGRPHGLRVWRASSTWRQGAHLVASAVLLVGGCLVAVSWLAVPLLPLLLTGVDTRPGTLAIVALAVLLLLVAPWAVRGLARLDTALAVALLGPSPTERMSQRVEDVTRSRSAVIEAADAERRRIERDLHDGAQQRLVSLAMNLGIAREQLGPDVPLPARRAIEGAHDEAVAALAELRELVRGLHPPVLEDRGLDAALSGVAARCPVPVSVRVDVEPRCSATLEAVAYFVVGEALTNVARHAHAGRAQVRVVRRDDRLVVEVEDDGCGGAQVGGQGDTGTGLRGLEQRATAADGTFTVVSPAGGPTVVTVELPCGS